MKTVQYGEWKIAVDVDKTKQYYSTFETSDTQANRNFAEYCKNLAPEEKAFFDALGITPTCCEIEFAGADRKGRFACGGHYYVYGEYLECPPVPQPIPVEDYEDDDESDSVYRVNIGIFEFRFQQEDYEYNEIPDDKPEGFICICFWCELMRWLLPEKPEVMLYEPPRFWEIHKIIKKKLDEKKQCALDSEQSKCEFVDLFEKMNIKAELLNERDFIKYKKKWVDSFAPKDDIKKARMLCVGSRRNSGFLWHLFSFEILNCEDGDGAMKLFDAQHKSDCVVVSGIDNIAFSLKNADKLNAEMLDQFTDVTVTAVDFSWTYSKTHEGMFGPYFYKK